jgi:hypothetical protein
MSGFLLQCGLDIRDGLDQIIGVSFQLRECFHGISFQLCAETGVIEKMGLPDDRRATLINSDQEREDGAAEADGCLAISHDCLASRARKARFAALQAR